MGYDEGMKSKRAQIQLDIADIVGRRYGVQVTTGNIRNGGGLEIYLTWPNARKLLEDLRHLDGEDGPAAE